MSGFSYDGDDVFVKGDDGTDEGAKITTTQADSKNLLDVNVFQQDLDNPNAGLQVVLAQATDMTNRLQVAATNRIFDQTWQYFKGTIFWSESITGTGAVNAPDPTDPAYLQLTTGTGANDKVVFQTKRSLPYQAFRSHLITFAANFRSTPANQIKRLGQFTDLDGWFFERSQNDTKVVVRNSSFESSGTIETAISRTNWNIDKLDGTGPSRLDVDLSKVITFVIEFVWHGTQGLKFGVQIFDKVYWVHFYEWSGTEDKPFSSSALLPLRFELENTASTTAGEFWIGPCSFSVEGGEQPLYRTFSASREDSAISVTASGFTQLLAIRPKTTLPNGAENRGVLIPTAFNILAETDIYYELVIAEDSSGGTWTDVATNQSVCQFNLGVTSLTNPRVFDSGYVTGGGNKGSVLNLGDFEGDIFAAVDALNSNTPQVYAIRARRLGGSGSAYASARWREAY